MDFLEKIKKLNIVFFKYRVEDAPQLKLPSDQQLGLIAQEVEAIFPELVVHADDGHLELRIAWLPFYLLRAVQLQQDLIEKLTSASVDIPKKDL